MGILCHVKFINGCHLSKSSLGHQVPCDLALARSQRFMSFPFSPTFTMEFYAPKGSLPSFTELYQKIPNTIFW